MEPVDVWADNLGEELAFWRTALSDPGPDGALQRERATPRAVWDELRRRVPADAETVRMLDVGSGPLTTLGTIWPERQVEVVATDPLADEYNALLDSLGIEPPVRGAAIRGEQLSSHLEAGSFHVVHAANSLDHSADPVVTLREMLTVAAPGGTLCLLHHVDVGELERYHGLHQWNLRPEGTDDMAIWNPTRRHLLSDIAPGARIELEEPAEGLFRVWLTVPAG